MKKRGLIFLVFLLLILYSFFIEPSILIMNKKVDIESEKINEDIKFVQISDLHIKKFYFFHSIILKKIKKIEPDFIVYTGDSLANNSDQKSLEKFFRELSEISDIYVIYGNWDFQDLNEVNKAYAYENIHLIEGKSELVEVKGQKILLTGLPMFYKLENFENFENFYSIFLTHVPDNAKKHIELIDQSDLILAGHTHGGQIYIPFLTKFLVNKIGNYSEFLRGMHDYNNSKLYINRGLGSWLNVRFLNSPEITIFYLKKDEE
ncbi:metallophosphoesterase [Geotoga petraea]|jgi:predicted MPP superfamily phosphohydrolase|uniref:Calcineurin-like phosphoesterase domain-containing protein n=1 Tax=Geotoga petraea TaxID=28234 RepID=A0A1G6QEG7_9BACT|nr:metallophosphoesterase [Geotoga petraea]MDK2945873.1 uncharacterized protein [Geotoga sp.]SDC90571.1 hypothetical protein SAMN04488588_2049 [Geotoga petraea]